MDSLGTDFDALLTRGAVVVLLLAGAWALAVVLAVAIEARTGGRVRIAQRTGCPPVVRLWLLGLFAAVLAGIAPAQASDSGAGPGTTIDAALDGLPLPDRASDPLPRSAVVMTGHEPVAHRAAGRPVLGPVAVGPVVVGPGDSLWLIARARLPHGADDADVAVAVAALYAANRPVIGPDPDRLQPGQHLVFPDLSTHPEEP